MNNIENTVKQWLRDIVIGLQLCPFAKAPLQKNQIRFFVSQATKEEILIEELIAECQRLDEDTGIETTLLICPNLLQDFFDYTQFLSWAEQTLKRNQWQGIYQIASFHPDYQFSNTDKNDLQNLTNRSPYPMLHILREASLSSILDRFSEPETIPEKNIQTMKALSPEDIRRLFYYL
jgi:hypothetical protein